MVAFSRCIRGPTVFVKDHSFSPFVRLKAVTFPFKSGVIGPLELACPISAMFFHTVGGPCFMSHVLAV
ncbi:MAG TPA: hypothetical protein VFD60_02735 [Nitrososphaeraceae archaeon]|nr:hypothetical protein [Nitrososphaeraceae archaeon]